MGRRRLLPGRDRLVRPPRRKQAPRAPPQLPQEAWDDRRGEGGAQRIAHRLRQGVGLVHDEEIVRAEDCPPAREVRAEEGVVDDHEAGGTSSVPGPARWAPFPERAQPPPAPEGEVR